MCVLIHMCVHVYGSQRSALSSFFSFPLHYLLRQGLSKSLEPTELARQSVQETPGFFLSASPALGSWTLTTTSEVLLLPQQAFCQLSHLCSPCLITVESAL